MPSLDRRLTGKLPILDGRVGERPAAIRADVLRTLGATPTAGLSDLVGRLYTMDSGIRPLYQGAPAFVGTAVTVRTARGDNRAVKEAVSHVQAGDLLVIDAQGFTEWCVGGWGMLRQATSDGLLAGLIVDGAYRDADDFRVAGMPLYGRALNPATGPKLQVGEINVPAACGGVIVYPGDVIVGDIDGIVVVPHAAAVAVAEEARRRASDG